MLVTVALSQKSAFERANEKEERGPQNVQKQNKTRNTKQRGGQPATQPSNPHAIAIDAAGP